MSNEYKPTHPSMNPGMEEPRHEMGGSMGGYQTGRPADMRGEGMAAGVKNMASQAGEKLMDTAESQKRAGADYVISVADAVRRAAGEFDEQIPQAGEYIRSAAAQMESMAESLRRRDVAQMFSDVQSFARRQPTAFLGASFLAGFVAMRFLRSSSGSANGQGGSRPYQAPDDDGRYGSPSAMAGRNDLPSGTQY